MATFETSLKSRLIYVFAIPDEWHKDCLKVGETTLEDDGGEFPQPNSEVLNKAARDRIDQYTKTAGIAYTLLHTEMTVFFKGGTISSFNDKQVHSVLERSGVKKKTFDTVKGANEWFCCDLETIKKHDKQPYHHPACCGNIIVLRTMQKPNNGECRRKRHGNVNRQSSKIAHTTSKRGRRRSMQKPCPLLQQRQGSKTKLYQRLFHVRHIRRKDRCRF